MFHHAMREEYLKPTPLKPYMTYADHLVWPIHVPRRCEPLITPHLSLWGNSRTRATFPTQEKPQSTSTGGEGEGGQYGYITLRGGGGCLPNLDHIYTQLCRYTCTWYYVFLNDIPGCRTSSIPESTGPFIIHCEGENPKKTWKNDQDHGD